MCLLDSNTQLRRFFKRNTPAPDLRNRLFSTVFLNFSVPVSSSAPMSSVFQCLQCSSISRGRWKSTFTVTSFLLEGRLLGRSSDFGYFSSPARRGLHESGCPWGRTLCCGYPWPNAFEVFLGPRAEQDRQEPSNWCLVNVGCSLRPNACRALALWVVGRGQFSFVLRDVASHPLGQLFCMNFTKLT